jgi:hypothetical protein
MNIMQDQWLYNSVRVALIALVDNEGHHTHAQTHTSTSLHARTYRQRLIPEQNCNKVSHCSEVHRRLLVENHGYCRHKLNIILHIEERKIIAHAMMYKIIDQ